MKLPVDWNWKTFRKRIEKRDLFLIGGVGFLFFFLLLYGLWLRPNLRVLQGLYRELQTLRIQIRDAQSLTNVSRIQKEITEIERSFGGRLFKRNEVPRTLELLKDHITQYRLDILTLKPELKETLSLFVLSPDLSLETIPIHLRFKGDYVDTGRFLGSLKGLPFLMTLDTLHMGSPQTIYPKVETEITLSLYLERQEGTPRGR